MMSSLNFFIMEALISSKPNVSQPAQLMVLAWPSIVIFFFLIIFSIYFSNKIIVWNHILIIFSKHAVFSYIYFSFFLNGIDQYSQFSTNFILVTPPDLTLTKNFYFGMISIDSSFTGNIIDLYTGCGARVLIQPSALSYCQLSIGIQQPFCLYCSTLAYAYNGTCVLSCPSGTYRDINTMTCRFCSNLCNECTGPQDSACLSCITPYPYFFNSRCFSSCPLGTSASINFTCSCDPSCQTCAYDSTSNMALCQSCVNPSYFIVNGYQCVESMYCPYNFFGNIASMTCASTCSGNTYQNFANRMCSSYCTTGSVKFVNNGVSACYQNCPATYYNSTITTASGVLQSDQTNFQCSICQSPCLTCSESSCLSCMSGFLYHENNGSCNVNCFPGFVQIAAICRICRNNCTVCPNGFYLYNGTCLLNCPIGTTIVNSSCLINTAPIVTILNKTGLNSNVLNIVRNIDLILMIDYIYLSGSIDSIIWSLSGFSSVYLTEFFSNTYNSLQTLTIPRTNLRGNVLYNVSVAVYSQGVKGEDYILIQTYPDIENGVFNITPSSGVSGVTNFTLSLLLWNTSQNLTFNVYSYNQIVVTLSQNETIFGTYSPDVVFSNLTTNGNFSFVAEPVLENTNLTIELAVSNFDYEVRTNLTLSLLPYDGNISEIQNDLWRVNYTTIIDLQDIYQEISNIYLVYGIPYSQIYIRDTAIAVYKAARLLNQNPNHYCDDLINCHGNGVCQTNPLNSKSFSCNCFSGYAGDTCAYDLRIYQLMSNYTLTLMLNLNALNITSPSTNPLIYLKCIRTLLDLQDLFLKNGVILAILSLEDLLQLPNLSIESLTLMIENLGLVNYQLYERTTFRLDEQSKYSKLISTLLDSCLNQTENLQVLGQDSFISSKYLDVYLSKKPRFSLLSGLNGYLIIPLSKIQVYIPIEAFSIEDIVIVRIIQWKADFEDIETTDTDISSKGQIELKIAGQQMQIQNLTNPVLIYMAKIANYVPLNQDQTIPETPYICGSFDETLMTFNSQGCQFMNETNSFILCNCTHFSTFSAQIIPTNISNPPSLLSLIDENNLNNEDISISSLLSVDFATNLIASRYIPLIIVRFRAKKREFLKNL